MQTSLVANPLSAPNQQIGYLDAWYADDGEALLLPERVDMYLQHLDREAALVGASRGSGDDIKSTVMLIGAPAVVASYGDAWVTPYISQTCKILTPNSEVEVLGGAVGGPGLATALFGQALHKGL